MPFGAEMCDTAVELKPDVVSFHFGLPEKSLLDRIKAAGSMVFSSATTVAEARWLEDNGVDAVIAQGVEAGGHRGMFLTGDVNSQRWPSCRKWSTQSGSPSLQQAASRMGVGLRRR
jgi:nitronate monooxygenase